MSSSEERLGSGRIVPLVLSMALPLILSMAFQAVYNIADSLFISRYSAEEFAGVSVIQPLVLIITALSAGLATGMGSLLSRSLGEGSRDKAKKCIATAFSIAILLTLLLTPLYILIREPFTVLYTDNSTAVNAGEGYLFIFALGIIAVFFSQLSAFILQAHARSRQAMIVQASGAIFNIVFDPVFIFTLGLGADGAAIATVLGYLLSSLLGFILIRQPDVLKALPGFDKTAAKGIAQVAFPALLAQGAGPIVGIIFNSIVLSYGINEMVVYGMYLKMESFMFLACSGISSALVVIAGYNYGAGHNRRVWEAYGISLAMGWSVMLLGFLFFQLASPFLVRIFTTDPEIIALGIPAFRRLSCCFLLTAPNIVTTGLLQGIGKGGRSMLITYIRFFLFLIPLAFLLSHFYDFYGLCLSYAAADVPTLAVIVLILHSIRHVLR